MTMDVQQMLSAATWPLVLYHASCRDGWCAAYLAKLRFPDAELVPQQYADPVATDAEGRWVLRVDGEQKLVDFTNRDVLILDFSYPRKTLERMKEAARSILVLDHHKSAAEDLKDLDYAVFDEGRSGCGLALDYFFPGSRERVEQMELGTYRPRVSEPAFGKSWTEGGLKDVAPTWLTVLTLTVEDWDLWRYARPGTKEVCAYLDTLPRTTEAWQGLPSKEAMGRHGAAVLAYQAQQVERISEHAQRLTFPGGAEINVVNSPVLQSEVGQALYEKDPTRAALVWYRNERWEIICSLRSKKDSGIDVAEMARKFGGGGHANAAGFKLADHEHENVGWLLYAPESRIGQA